MSRENVEAVRGCLEAYVRGDYAAAARFLAPDVVWDVGQELPARGPAAVQEVWRRWDAEWDELETVAEEIVDAGEKVVMAVRYRGRGRLSGVEVDDLLFEVHAFRNGRVIRKVEFPTRQEALEAAGIPDGNEAIARKTFEAIGRWDIDALLALYHPEIEFLPLTGTRVESGGYYGHAGVRAYFDEVGEVWESMQPRAETVHTVGDRVVVFGGCAVRGRGSGAVSDSPMAWVLTIRDGKVARHHGYRTPDEALEAAELPDEGERTGARPGGPPS
jgi:ketosteroid isomerase-like protein